MQLKKIKSRGTIWLDVDSVLLDFTAAFHHHLNQKYEFGIPDDYLPPDTKYGQLFANLKTSVSKEIDKLPSAWWQSLRPIPGAVTFTHILHKMGFRVVLLTSSPAEHSPARIACLTINGFHFDEIYFTRGLGITKGELAFRLVYRYENQNINLFIDDMIRNCVDFLHSIPETKTFCMDWPYNQSMKADPEAEPYLLSGRIDCVANNQRELFKRVLYYIRSIYGK